MKRVFAVVFALTWLGAGTAVLADVPTEMSVQGRLTNNAGAPVPAGLKNFTFKIFDAPVAGVEIWPAGPGELQTLATDANGLWNAGVGSLIPLTEAVFLAPVRWLEVTVDDGVNPPETLPRIELRTNPYTYRAATSQQADSIAGNSFGDLADLFVNEAADTMSGQLRIDWDHSAGKSTLEIENINNGYLSTWSDGIGTWGMSVDANSDNGPFNLGVGGECLGDNTANYGLYGVARGFGSTNFAVYGNAGDGVKNYAGYFQGDLLVQNLSGDSGVSLPNDAISASEILDEPGIAFSALVPGFGATLVASGTAQDFLTVTISTPAAGYVVVHGIATIRYTGTTGTNFTWMQIDQTAGGGFNTRWAWSGAFTRAGTGNEYETTSLTRVYGLAAGTHTFRMEGNMWVSNNVAAADFVFQAELMATFFTGSYGSVASIVAERGDFEDAQAVRITDPQAGVSAEYYEVDLRELELKAAREQAEAEQARRALVEAQLSALGGKVPTTAQEKK